MMISHVLGCIIFTGQGSQSSFGKGWQPSSPWDSEIPRVNVVSLVAVVGSWAAGLDEGGKEV